MNTFEENYDHHFKFLLLGDMECRKSEIVAKFIDDLNLKTTIGVEFHNKRINVDGKIVKLQVWDAAGQERFREITKAYCKDAHGVFLVFNSEFEDSFSNLGKWLDLAKEHAPEQAKIMILGLYDNSEHKIVDPNDAQKFANDKHLNLKIISLKENSNIRAAFTDLTQAVLDGMKSLQDQQSSRWCTVI